MKQHQWAEPVEPADVVSSIFTARRDLLDGVKAVLRGSGLTVEEADLLISLYGARVLKWNDLEHDEEGFVPFNLLERYLVHNPSLLSRRIGKLAGRKPPFLQVEAVDPASGLHVNAKKARITDAGVEKIAPVWKRYQQLSAILLKGIPSLSLKHHYEVNETISARIRARRQGWGAFLSGAE